MKLPLSWLADYVPVTLPPRELAERLTMSGSLVEKIHLTGSQWDEILVARVLQLERHPNADTLWLVTVDLGERQQTVVTAAQNLFVGALVPYIGVGSRLPGQAKPLEARKMRGIVSEGMVCAGDELGLNDDHEGILILDRSILGDRVDAPDIAGTPLSRLLGEIVLELEITPNRPDCLSIYGLAREVAAITGEPLRPIPTDLQESPPPAGTLASVRIEAPELCSRFTARVIAGVTVGPSPEWLVARLQAAGVRPINNIVDVTNYVMLELGQPLHAYDLDTLVGPGLVVRRAHAGEHLTTLDGVERALTPEMLVIADHERAVGIAGVMGGGNTEVSESTTRVLLEAATFDARSVRRTSTALGLRTEASSRFEKGLPRTLAPIASDRAAALIAQLGGGSVAEGLLDAGEPEPDPRHIEFSVGEVSRLLGVDWPVERIVGNLEALSFACRPLPDARVHVTIPWWRNDVDESADLVEEVARVTGFDAIPETLLRGTVPPRPTSLHQRWYAPTRRLLLACGLSEGSGHGLASRHTLEMLRPEGAGDDWLSLVVPHPEPIREAGARFQPVRVVNPLTPEREILRPTLLPGLLEALRDNLRAGEERVAFFEIDFCAFAREGDLPVERRTLALAMTGERHSRSWAVPATPIDFFDLKGVVEQMTTAMGLTSARIVSGEHPLLHPGRSALLQLGGLSLGFLGELHPAIAERWDLGSNRAYIAEFDFEALADQATNVRTFVDYPRLPVARRDLAVVVDETTPAEDVVALIRDTGKDYVARVVLFDVYRGDQIPAGRKSLAYAVELQAGDRTLTEQQIDRTMGRIQRALEHRLGATFRG